MILQNEIKERLQNTETKPRNSLIDAIQDIQISFSTKEKQICILGEEFKLNLRINECNSRARRWLQNLQIASTKKF